MLLRPPRAVIAKAVVRVGGLAALSPDAEVAEASEAQTQQRPDRNAGGFGDCGRASETVSVNNYSLNRRILRSNILATPPPKRVSLAGLCEGDRNLETSRWRLK